jgi:hypothetical protein
VKAITLWQPWASLVAVGAKRIETRSWPTSYRGELAIHAAAALPKSAQELWDDCGSPFRLAALEAFECLPSLHQFPRGVIVATCRLVDCIEISDRLQFWCTGDKELTPGYATPCSDCIPIPPDSYTPEYLFGDYTPGRYAWILADIKALPEPIPAKGKQGLWEWDMPEASR